MVYGSKTGYRNIGRGGYGYNGDALTQPQCSFFFDDGTTDIITFGDILDTELNSGVFSLFTVFRRNAIGTTQGGWAKWDGAGTRVFQSRINTSNQVQVFISNDGSTSINVASTSTITDTTNFHSVVVVVNIAEPVNADRVKVYIDGSIAAMGVPSGTFAVPFAGSTESWVYGNDTESGSFSFAGYHNQPFMTSDVATAAEISTWHNGGQPLYGLDVFDNVVLFPDIANSTFDGTNWSVPDLSGNSYTGVTQLGSVGSGDLDCNESPYL